MKIGVIGLGKMGSGILERLHNAGHQAVGFDIDKKSCLAMKKNNFKVAGSIQDFFAQINICWVMVPIGDPLEKIMSNIKEYGKKNLIIIEGSNNHFLETRKYAQIMHSHGFSYLDCGTSGGLKGKDIGFSLMIGGEKSIYEKAIPFFKAVAGPESYGYVGPSGSGHYVKMVHNGIEYAMLQSYAEGFHLLKEGSFTKDAIDMSQVTKIWKNRSVIRSWLLELSHEVFATEKDMENVSGEINEGGTGLWAAQEAKRNNIEVPAIQKSLEVREWSRKAGGDYSTKIIALLRNKFGGHEVRYKNKKRS